jgi:hypothetical protein
VSLVFGLLSLTFACTYGLAFIAAVLSVVFGMVSLLRLSGNPRLGGRGMAIAGITLSAVPLAVGIYLLVTTMQIQAAHNAAAG